jgi:hypothetical protein
MEEQQNYAALYWCVIVVAAKSPQRPSGYCFFFRAAAARGFAAVLVLALALGAGTGIGVGAGGLSPIIPLSGQILKAGHFLQPTTMAIGQIVMGIPVMLTGRAQYARSSCQRVVCFA